MLFADIDEIIDGTEKPLTNADRIRAMSDEELARFICGCCECDSGYCPGANLCVFGGSKANGLLKWLQQPAEKGD